MSPIQTTPPAEIDRLFDLQLQAWREQPLIPREKRLQQLKKLYNHILSQQQAIRAALMADFGKPPAEVDLTEMVVSINEIKHAMANLKRWCKPHRVSPTLLMATTRSRVHYEAKGVVMIMAPWNYPFMLIFGPLAGALAAGNRVILKPSEITVNTSRLVREIISAVFPEEEVATVEGGADESRHLLEKPFHHIFFTGSPRVGKLVMSAAAKNLTDVTLELGGKTPAIVHRSAAIRDAAEKIVWGKFSNTGQTCIAPDFVWVEESVAEAFQNALQDALNKFYGVEEDRQANPDFGRISSDAHFQHLSGLRDAAIAAGAKVLAGGPDNPQQRYIAPTVLTGVETDSPIMEGEIFGPLLPVLTFREGQDIFQEMRLWEKPLAMYIFSRDRGFTDKALSQSSAGTTCVNDTLIHFFHVNLPFGGVNTSGLGKSHGFAGFQAFSNARAVLIHHRFSPLRIIYPPYGKFV
ncbi:MAG: aldehyde dehydrogenase family protein, partial [Calditrichaeota bacterium]|nr:aldehyde dehydrogenase family protein [Calditrichota bacterium]